MQYTVPHAGKCPCSDFPEEGTRPCPGRSARSDPDRAFHVCPTGRVSRAAVAGGVAPQLRDQLLDYNHS